jgi:two-component system OmpR family sensor kinase
VTLPLRARLAVISTLVSGLFLSILSVVSYGVLSRGLDADASTRLIELTDGLHGYLRFHGDTPTVEFNASDGDQAAFVQEATRYYQIYDTGTGRLLFESNGFAPLGLYLTPTEIRSYQGRPSPFDISTEYGRVRVSNSVVRDARGHEYLLQVGVSLRTMDAALRRYRDLLLWLLPAALALSALAAWWLSGFALRPLTLFATAAREIDVRTLERRLPTRKVHDELEDVARAFNDTLARVEHSVGEMRQFSAALAHELRTPLAALRGEIELALRTPGIGAAQRSTLASQIEELDRLTRLIDQILTLARAESGQIRLTFAPVDVGALAASLVEQLEPVAQARTIELRCERSGALVINADAGWLQRLMLNLLDNAIKFTKEGGHVVLCVTRDAEHARIDVRDTGIGMSPDVTQHVFERFFQADPARSSDTEGAGVGLSLVKWIVDRHNGTILIDSRVGEGSTFTVLLPGAPA